MALTGAATFTANPPPFSLQRQQTDDLGSMTYWGGEEHVGHVPEACHDGERKTESE